MKYIKFMLIAAAAVMMIGGCKTSPPVNPELRQDYGRVFISSNTDSARIYIDNVFTGRYTNDTIVLAAGLHSVRLEKDNYAPSAADITVKKDSLHSVYLTMQQVSAQKIVLLEDFANVSCAPCVVSNQIIEQLEKHTYGHGKLIAVKYPTNFPSPNDPFYNANKPDADARISYYRVLSAPTIFIDGIEKPAATDSNAIKAKIDARLAAAPLFGLTVSKTISGADLNIAAEINFIDNMVDLTDLAVHVVVIESKIEYATPPGSNGETKFYNVLRVMLPGSGGTSLAGVDKSLPYSLNLHTTLASSWNSAEINAVVFIQNTRTKEVFQAASTM